MTTKAQPQTDTDVAIIDEELETTEFGDGVEANNINNSPDTPNDQLPQLNRKLWIVELWDAHKKVFSYLTIHIILTFIAVFFLIKIHSLIEGSSLPPDEKKFLLALDFYVIAICLVLLGADFLYKMAVFIIRSIIKLHKEEH